jgi:hypothetical protein
MTPRAVSFVTGFACGAIVFIALQSFGQSDVECAETGWRCQPQETPAPAQPQELPALGELSKERQGADKDKHQKSLIIPVVATVGMIGVLSLWGSQSNMPCATYPCAHYGHIGTGAAIGYLFTSYYSPQSALVAGLAVGVGKELMDKQNGKTFNRTDVVTRLLGTGIGIYLAKTF